MRFYDLHKKNSKNPIIANVFAHVLQNFSRTKHHEYRLF